MINEREGVVRRIKMLLDALIITGAFFLSYYIFSHFHLFYRLDLVASSRVIGSPAGLRMYLPVLILWVSLWIFMLSLNGVYRSLRAHAFFEVIWIIIKSGLFSTLAFTSVAFLLKIEFISRIFILIFTFASFALLILEKRIVVSVIHNLLLKGYNLRNILVVGTGPRAERFVDMINAHPEWGFSIIGLIDDDTSRVGKKILGAKVMGTLKDIPQILRKKIVDEVVFVVPRMWLQRIQHSVAACETQGIKAHVAADLFDLNIAKARQTDLEGFPLLTFETTFAMEWQLFIKRSIDLVASGLGIVFLSPLFLLVSIIIKTTSPGPVFFKQRRVGLNGRIFTLFKFRSMYKNAQEKLKELEHLNEASGPVFKIKDDPRITPIGRFMRKTSIDELPQLFNVFMAQMSLVGPRPPIPSEVRKYRLWQRRRLSMRPGITCLWQVSGRSKISFERWMELDLEYIDHWCLRLDFNILMKTIPAVTAGVGAH
ncbi:sugar transferase [Candidatus Omnitrophota bacterium]